MAKSKRGGKSHESGYARYKTANKETINRVAKLTKLAKLWPNNEQIAVAIKNVRHRRNTPISPFWHPSTIKIARIIKQFTGKFDKGIFATDPDTYNAAIRVRNPNKFLTSIPNPKGSMFSIGERLGWKF
jgi:hypothetical protein